MSGGGIKTGVVGHPIAHSKSPLIHNYWIKKYGLSGHYEAIDIPCAALEAGLQGLRARGFAGFNLTLPHKELVLPLCDVLDDVARAVGAVNTVVIENGALKGRNTDVFGFIQNIRENAPGFDFARGPAVVLGAGGAAKAVVYALLQEGAPEIILLNRTQDKAEKLSAANSKIKVQPWELRGDVLAGANMLVNTTSLGMQRSGALEIDLAALPVSALVHDIVYAPLETDLLKQAQARGNAIVTGIGMLLHQARPAFEAWYGVMPEVTPELRALVLRS